MKNKMIYVIAFALFASGCSQREWEDTKVYESTIYQAKMQMQSQRYSEAIRTLENYQSKNPLSPALVVVEKMLLDAYYHQGEYPMLLAGCERFLYEHLDDPHRDYIAYLKCSALYYQAIGYPYQYLPIDRAYRDISPHKEAFFAIKQFFNEYPHSAYRTALGRHLPELKNTIARSYYLDAQLLEDRHQMIGAIKAYQNIVDQFEDSDYSKDAQAALEKIASSYHLQKIYKKSEKT